jgi:hypothetical protein
VHVDLGEVVLELAENALERVVIAAPFIKGAALEHIVSELREGIELTVVTRWVPEEIASGVSDVEVWDVVRALSDAELRLFPGIHAKYFRFDDAVLLGSANVTARALGWVPRPNLELLVEVAASSLASFEADLLSGSFEVDDLTADAMREAAQVVAGNSRVFSSVSGESEDSDDEDVWFPRSLQVQYLFDCYRGNEESVISSVFVDGLSDLQWLRVPQGLDRSSFTNYVAVRLQQLPYVAIVDESAAKAISRSQGQALLAHLGVAADSSACEDWDRLVGWLVTFLPRRFRVKQTYTGPALERSQLIR